ncbi:MAG: hypothetical protein AB4290_03320 [Spirulina sp.]
MRKVANTVAPKRLRRSRSLLNAIALSFETKLAFWQKYGKIWQTEAGSIFPGVLPKR